MVDIKKSFGRAKDHMIQRSRVRIQEQRLEQVRVERERKPGWFKPPLMRPGDARQCCGWSAAHLARGAQAGGGGGGEGCQGPGQPTRRAAGSALHDGPSHSGARRASPFRQLMLNEEGGGALVVVAHLRRARLAGVAPRSRLAGPAARLRPPFVLLQAPGYKDVHLLSGQRVTRAIDTPLYRIEVSETLSQSQGRPGGPTRACAVSTRQSYCRKVVSFGGTFL